MLLDPRDDGVAGVGAARALSINDARARVATYVRCEPASRGRARGECARGRGGLGWVGDQIAGGDASRPASREEILCRCRAVPCELAPRARRLAHHRVRVRVALARARARHRVRVWLCACGGRCVLC